MSSSLIISRKMHCMYILRTKGTFLVHMLDRNMQVKIRPVVHMDTINADDEAYCGTNWAILLIYIYIYMYVCMYI